MACGRALVAAILAGMIAACGASSAPSPPSNEIPTGAAAPATARPTTTPGTSAVATDSSLSPSAAPTNRPSPQPTPVALPPKPTGVSFAEQRRLGNDASSTEITQTVRWRTPKSRGVEVRVYGVTECIAKPATPSPETRGPCLVEHTPLRASVLTLLATAPASDGVASWSWTGTFDCGEPHPAYDPDGPAYYAVVLAAYSQSGHSIFAIAEAGGWWEPGPDEIVC